MNESHLEQKFLFRAIKVAYILALLFGLFIVGALGWGEKPTTYIDGKKTTINCTNGKNYATNDLDIYLWEKETQLDTYDDRKAKIVCTYGVKEDYGTKYNLPSTANYTVNYVESVRGDWFTAILWWGIGFVVVYAGLNLIRETLIYMFFGRPFTFDWLVKLIDFFNSPQE